MNWIKRLLRQATQESQPEDFGYVTIIYPAGKDPVVAHDLLGITTPLSENIRQRKLQLSLALQVMKADERSAGLKDVGGEMKHVVAGSR